MTDPVETAELLAFSKTVDTRSLSRAAAELGVPRATISRRLARLEARLGARLLRRTTRSLVLTDAGEALYRHARIVLDAVSQAEASVRRTDEAVRGELRVSVPPMMQRPFLSLLCNFAEQHPEVRLHVHFSTKLVDLQRDGYDVALRASTHLEPGLIARTLMRDRLLAVASPEYLARQGVPRTLRDLKAHRCLMGFARGELPATHWSLADGGQLHLEGSFFSNEVSMLHEAALHGLGIALLPSVILRPSLDSGRLVQVLPGVVEVESHVAAVYPEREFVPPQVRAFLDALVAWGQKELPKARADKKASARARSRRPR
ncbi:MAG TPA: LysR substrate-binding domain-containing protein [Polyangiaceae bacterium]|nr:LysR substrate-binding domain-containing protein [Polyangiaceae bacterium]